MRIIVTVITLAASVSSQFRAFPLNLLQHSHRAHINPCKPVTPHCAISMHGGHYGPRTHDGIPPYTEYLEDIEDTFYGVKQRITAYKKPDNPIYGEKELQGSVNSESLTQYVTILTAVKDLIYQVALNGPEFYPHFYLTTVLKTVKEVSNNPVQATGRLWAHMDNFLEHISQIRTLIKHKQETECEKPNSNECDIIIHFTLIQSSDQELTRQADFLVAGGKEVKIFMKIANLIENAADDHQAEGFLSNGDELLEPLVIAGFETMKVYEAIASLRLHPTHLYVPKNKFSTEQILDFFENLRSNEEKEIKEAQSTDNPVHSEKADALANKKLHYVVPPEYDDYLVNLNKKATSSTS